MLNIIWPIFIVISCAYGILTGRINQLNDAIFASAKDAINLCITFLGTITLWNGIMNIAGKTTLIDKLSNLLKPIIKILFPEVYENEEIRKDISMNIVANAMGLGNAATPLGIKAMRVNAESE